MAQGDNSLSDKSRELIERSYQVRERMHQALEEVRRLSLKREGSRPGERGGELPQDPQVGVAPDSIQTSDEDRQ